MIRILIADEHRIYREGLRRLLGDYPDLEITAEAGTRAEIIKAVQTHPIDCVIVDVALEGADGVDLLETLKRLQPTLRILVVALQNGDFAAVRALRAGADGYMTKDGTCKQVVAAVHHIMQGSRYVCPEIAAQMALSIGPDTGYREAHESLTERERKVFELLVAGKRGAEIACELNLSEKTVSTHKMHVLQKLAAHSSSDLVRYAIRHQLINV